MKADRLLAIVRFGETSEQLYFRATTQGSAVGTGALIIEEPVWRG